MELNAKVLGEGKPLIIIHGLLGSLDNWQSIAKELAMERRVFSLDMRNHGRSPHDPEISYPIMARDIYEFMDQHYLSSACLLGHSMGGKVAMEFALRYPRMAEALIVVDIAPKAYKGTHEIIFEALLTVPLQQMNQRSEVEQWMRDKIQDEVTLQFLLKSLTRNENQQFIWRFNPKALQENYAHILANISTELPAFPKPCLFIKGESSAYIRESDHPEILRQFPKSQFVEIPKAGHWVQADQPAAFLHQCRQFLASL